jgi:endonuclease/exonuclease/phosphatase family metal-dependent hydrolase
MLHSLLRRRFAALIALFALGTVASACADDSSETSSSSAGGGGTGGSGGGGGAGGGEPIKILNWNIKNFLDDENNSDAPDEFIQDTEDYQAQIAAAAAILEELDPDVAVLQEIENEGVLADLNAALGGRYVDLVAVPGNDPRGVNIAAMSKIAFSEVVSHKDDQFVLEGTQGPTYTFARDCVELHLTHAGQPIALLGVHFRSKGPPDDPNKRLAEAQRARAIANELTAENGNLGVIVLGDFNDLPGSDPYLVVGGPESNRYTDVATFVPEAERWTFDFQGAKELIDHQMANPRMFGFVNGDSVVIRKGTDVGNASDHFPMMATYYVR